MIAAVALAIGLAAFGAQRLRTKGYNPYIAASLSILTMLQALVCFRPAVALSAMLLALALTGIAAATASMIERQDIRSVVAVGGALAAAQFLTPLGSLVTAAALPLLLATWHPRPGLRQAIGFGTLLLFPPVLAALLRIWLPSVFRWPAAAVAALPVAGGWSIVAAAVVSMPIAIATFLRRRDGRAVLVAPIVCFALIAALAAATMLGAMHDAREAAAALAPVILLASCCWRPGPRRGALAIATSASTAALAWLICVAAPG